MAHTVFIFVSTDYIGLATANHLIPKLLTLGLRPVLLDTSTRKNRRFKNAPLKDASFYNVMALERAIAPFMDARPLPNLHGTHTTFKTYQQLSTKYGLDYHQVSDVNDVHTHAIINQYSDALGSISLRLLQVFDTNTIALMKQRGFFWNLHSGTLPDYKGLLIPYHAILRGEKAYGWTLHEVVPDIDVGNIVARSQAPLLPSKPIFETYLEMVKPSADMVFAAISKHINEGTVALQANTGGQYYSYPAPEQIATLRKMGVCYVESLGAFLQQVVTDFSIPGTRHANDLKDAVIAVYAQTRTSDTIADTRKAANS